MRRLILLLLVATLGLCAPAEAAPLWTTYRHDAARSGIDPDSANPVTPSQAWQTSHLDSEVYGQPLVYGSDVYVATENDTIYALDAATGAVTWSTHLATPEASTVAPCGDISPSIGITSTPVIDPTTNRIYAVGAVSVGGSIHHDLFAVDLTSGQQAAGFPIAADPSFPSGGSAVNQLQRAGLALDHGRILIGYGGNDGDCSTYWGWLVSAPESGTGANTSFQVDASHHEGAIWAAGNAPAIDPSGNVFVATGNGAGNSTSDPDFGDAVVKLNASAQPLDWWAPTNWHSLDSSDADLGSSMPTLLPGGYLFQSGKDGNGYILNGASLGNVSAAPFSGSCGSGSFGGSVYDPANSTIYATCGGLKALSLASGTPPSFMAKPGFSATSAAKGPPMIAGGLVWATNDGGMLYGIDPTTGATSAQFSLPESGSDVNHFASPSAGGGRLFVASGDQVTAFTIAQAPATGPGPTPTPAGTAPVLSRLRVSPGRVHLSRRHRFKAKVTYTLSEAATVTLTVKRRVRAREGGHHWVHVHGRITLKGKPGPNAFTFHGRIGGHKLRRGSYELVAAPNAGGLTGTARTAKFVIVG
jgi:polyvinyl alcohol dehydrogenase (cytochrome)